MRKALCIILSAILFALSFGSTDAKASKKISLSDEDKDRVDTVNYDYYTVKAEKTYYVGHQKSSFLNKNIGKYDEVLYFGDTYYLGDDAKSCKISNKKIAKIVGEEIIPLKQGIFTLTTPAKKKIKIAVTTYNDGKDPITARSQDCNGWYTYSNAFDAEDAKARIHTISDAIDVLEYREFKYSYCEPFSQWVGAWTWLQSGKSIYDYNTGVCADITQLMCYLLVEDFEDMGVIWISGDQGHAFNYYYEDGYYYLFDATEVISDLMNGEKLETEEYQKRIIKCESIDDIKYHVFKVKGINKETNYLVNMVSLQGHDYTPVSLTSGCNLSPDEIYKDKAKVEWGLDEVAYKGMVILWQNPEVNLEVKSISSNDIPIPVRMSGTAVYCNTVKAVKKRK